MSQYFGQYFGDSTAPGAGGTIPAASDVRSGVAVGTGTGTLIVPSSITVLNTATYDNGTIGTVHLPTAAQVQAGVSFGPNDSLTGTFSGGGTTGTSPSTITINDPNGNPVEGAEVFIALQKGVTDANGQCVINVIDGATNYLTVAYPNNETGRIGDAFTAAAD